MPDDQNKLLDSLELALAAQQIACRRGALLRDYTSFRLGGPCPLLINCRTPEDVICAVGELRRRCLDFVVTGDGSNLLVSDQGLSVPVVRFVSESPDIQRHGDALTVGAGTRLDTVAFFCIESGLSGMENTCGVPGTVGGAVAGNAGAFGWQLGDCLKAVRVLESDGSVHEVPPSDLGFSYRQSRIGERGAIVLGAVCGLVPGDVAQLRARRAEILKLRREKHPDVAVVPCAGSFFRNLEPTSAASRRQAAGGLLEDVGAKQMRVRGAGVFPRHANILVKVTEDCRAQDVLDLARQMAAAVYAKFGVKLVREVRVLGAFAGTDP